MIEGSPGNVPGAQKGVARVERREEPRPGEHSGYFSDRNESFGSRRDLYDRGYTSDHDRRFYDRQDSVRSGYTSDHERGYASDRDSRGYVSDRAGTMADRDRGYMSDRERGYLSDRERGGYTSNRERGYYSDRERGYMSDRERGYMSDRERGYMSDRERGYASDRDSRGYASDRERGYYSDREHTALIAQASMESADSRLCYLTSSEISDDDRMSLTTAVSEDEDGESADTSPYKGARGGGGTTAASFNCTGAVRKAGFLSVKKWLLRKKHQIELARKRGWKGYWVCLKGTTLLFYPCDSREGRSVEAAPKHLIIVDGAIMQPVPEHPKRDYIFCLSTAFGDAYLFQAPCQVELENWVNSIHSACAAAFARHRGKTGTLHLLQEEIFRIDRAIESDSKLKHMAELQLSVVSDVESKQQILGQIQQWEENLERLHCEQFRLRCYMASLQSGELPNPKGLLMHVSRTTKSTLSRLGVFTVSSFHAYICARSPSLLNNLLAGRGATKRRAPMLSRSNSVSSRRSLQLQQNLEPDKVYKVSLPDNQIANITLREAMTVEEFLVAASSGRGLNPLEHFVRVKKRRELEETNYFVPHRTDLIENYLATHEVVEICAKILYQVELSRSSLEHMWGFSVEAELIENSERQDELCCYISRVEDRSTAMQNGIIKSDEIMVINGAIVSDLDMMYIESVLQEELALCLMMRSSRTEPPDLASLMKTTDEIIESLVCPPPPSESSLNEEMISSMIVPAPSWSKQAMAGHHLQSAIPGMGSGHLGMNMAQGMGMNNMGSMSGLNSMPLISHGYNGMSNYGMGGMMLGIHQQQQQQQQQQQMPHSMLQYGKEPASPDGFPPPASDSSDRSNVSSLEIESFLKAGGGGNTSDLSGCSRSPVENRRPSVGGMGLGGHSGGVDRDMDRGGGMSTMLSLADRASTGSNMDRRGSTGGGGSTVGGPLDRTSPTGSLASSHSQSQLTPSRQLSHAERLRKVLAELVETEASYVKHLNNLLENYLEPLRNASFLTSAEVTALFGNIREIVAFQRLFLQALREAIDIEPDFQKFDQPYEFKNVLVSIASAFLYYASQFKLYSSFCASHSKAQKVLHPSEGNQALQEFLASRNPRQQHSATLESYLIKPIQRILKYPLLLQQLKNLTEPGTDENRHLVEALMVMEKVAEHINEMQRIHEEYGAIFDHLFRQHQKACKQVESSKPVDLSLGDLLYYGGVEWLNISDFLGKIKKGLELHAMCFVFKTAVVFLCKERLRQKKKLMGGVSGKNNSAEVEIIRYQVLIPVTEVQVRASSMKDMDSHFLWELIHLKNQLQRRSEKVYHLSNSTSEFRNAFLKTIRQIIRESVRNMSIPNKGPASGKDGGGSGASGGGSGGSGGSRGGSIGSSGGGSNSSSRQMNTNTLQSTRSAGGRRKQQPQNQSATLQRHSTGVMEYGSNMESYDNVPETHHNGHVPQRLEMNGAAAGYRNRGKTGSDATAVMTPKLEYKTITVYQGHPSVGRPARSGISENVFPQEPVKHGGEAFDLCNNLTSPKSSGQNTLGIPPLYTHRSTLPSQGVTPRKSQELVLQSHGMSARSTNQNQLTPLQRNYGGATSVSQRSDSLRNNTRSSECDGNPKLYARNQTVDRAISLSFSNSRRSELAREMPWQFGDSQRKDSRSALSCSITSGATLQDRARLSIQKSTSQPNYCPTKHSYGTGTPSTGQSSSTSYDINRGALHSEKVWPSLVRGYDPRTNPQDVPSSQKRNQCHSGQRYAVGYLKQKSCGNMSDSEANDSTPVFRKRHLRNSIQNLSEFDDTYDYPDLCVGKIVPQQHSPGFRNAAANLNQEKCSLGQGPKERVEVRGDVPSFLKACQGKDRSLEMKCNIRRIREVENIVQGWEFERVLQSDHGEPVPQIKNFKQSKERFVDRTESKHHAVSTLGTITDFLSSLPAEAKSATSAATSQSQALGNSNYSFSMRNDTRLTTARGRPRCSSESYGDSESSLVPSVDRMSVRGSKREHFSSKEQLAQPHLNVSHSIDPRRNTLPIQPQVPNRSSSLDTITIDSLLEQLKALK